MSIPRYFFSDICGTLYQVNTSYSFLMFYFRHRNWLKYFYLYLLLSWPAKAIWKIMGGVMDMEWLRMHLLNLLKGEREKNVTLAAKLFVHEVLQPIKNHAAWEQINSKIPLVLVSATLSTVAKAIAEEMEAEAYFATEMEVISGVLTGQIASDAKNNKLKLLSSSKYAPYINESYFMTDNKEDLPLVKTVKKAIIVTGTPARKRFWLEQQISGLTFLKND